MATAGGSSEIAYRLESLLTFVDAIDAQSRSSRQEPEETGDDDVVVVAAALRSRKVVAKAVREIIEQRWGVVRVGRTSPAADASSLLSSSSSLDTGDGDGESTGSDSKHAPVRDWRDLVVESRLDEWLN